MKVQTWVTQPWGIMDALLDLCGRQWKYTL